MEVIRCACSTTPCAATERWVGSVVDAAGPVGATLLSRVAHFYPTREGIAPVRDRTAITKTLREETDQRPSFSATSEPLAAGAVPCNRPGVRHLDVGGDGGQGVADR